MNRRGYAAVCFDSLQIPNQRDTQVIFVIYTQFALILQTRDEIMRLHKDRGEMHCEVEALEIT